MQVANCKFCARAKTFRRESAKTISVEFNKLSRVHPRKLSNIEQETERIFSDFEFQTDSTINKVSWTRRAESMWIVPLTNFSTHCYSFPLTNKLRFVDFSCRRQSEKLRFEKVNCNFPFIIFDDRLHRNFRKSLQRRKFGWKS